MSSEQGQDDLALVKSPHGKGCGMISTIEAGRSFFIAAADSRLIDAELNTAVAAANRYAMEDGQSGVLVTRHASRAFTVTVSAGVPYGEILEEDMPAELLADA